MEKVCLDLDGVSTWYFEPGAEKYWRLSSSGEPDKAGASRMLACLAARDVPNPDSLWMSRCRSAGVMPDSIEGRVFRPSSVTYKLFEHYQGIKHAQ